jgi:hypothetical protein
MLEGRANEMLNGSSNQALASMVDPPLGGQRLEELAQMPTWIATTSRAFDGSAAPAFCLAEAPDKKSIKNAY